MYNSKILSCHGNEYVALGPKDTQPEDTLAVTFTDYEKYLPFIYGNGKVDLGVERN